MAELGCVEEVRASIYPKNKPCSDNPVGNLYFIGYKFTNLSHPNKVGAVRTVRM